ncbi:MAG: PAS domain-containing protein, partial [Verrucomicrobiota bacterium]
IITYVNDRFCRISKFSREELLGQDHRIVNSGYHPKKFWREAWTTIGKGKVWKGEVRNRAKDGSYYWVDATIVPFLDDDGNVIQHVAIRTEITARKNAEEDREKLIQELKTALAEVKTLSGLLPICCSCKKVRDDTGYWNQIEAYISRHSDALFSHGYCPDCIGQVYEEAGLPVPEQFQKKRHKS